MDDFKKIVTEYLNCEKTNNPNSLFSSKLGKILNDGLYTGLNTSYEKCEDNYVGKVDGTIFILADDRYSHKDDIKIIENKNNVGKVVVLLESPHIDEFKPNLIAPALGETGTRLAEYLIPLLKNGKYISSDDELYLVNVIQYQCSLGYSTSVVRSRIFNYLFSKDDYKNNLKERLNIIKPTLIVISTTSFCKDNVKKWVRDNFNTAHILIADSHPSVWTGKTKFEEME